MRHWLMKSEPETFSLEDLRQRPGGTEPWNGVRNYQARNFMRDDMKVGDPVLFYHSNCPVPGVMGVAEVASKPYPDPTAFEEDSPYFDPKSDPENPRWVLVDVRYLDTFPEVVSLARIREEKSLATMQILRRGNRLSITPVTKKEYDAILRIAGLPVHRA